MRKCSPCGSFSTSQLGLISALRKGRIQPIGVFKLGWNCYFRCVANTSQISHCGISCFVSGADKIQVADVVKIFRVCLFGFLTSSSTTRLYRGRTPRQSVWQFYVLPHMRQSWETITSVSAGHIILTVTLTQPVESRRTQPVSNPGPLHQESRALPTELPCPQIFREIVVQELDLERK